MNPIFRRELLEVLRTRRAVALQLGLAAACALLVLVRWPTGEVADLSGARSLQVLRVFGYGLLAGVLLLVPAFPATSFVREKIQGTLALLLNSPMSPRSIYLGKLAGALGFTAVLLIMTLPAAAGCYVLGGTSTRGGTTLLYAVLALATLQLSTLALLVSARSQSTNAALRATYALVLTVCVFSLAPHVLLRGGDDFGAQAASWLRCLSPIPPVMQILGHGDVGSHGLSYRVDTVMPYVVLATLSSLICAAWTISLLNHTLLDRTRAKGVMTEERSRAGQVLRRIFFLVDPQARAGSMTLWLNPVMIKEFRTRRFGRSHWMLRTLALSAILSLGLSCIAAAGALGLGLEEIGGGLVVLQIALLILFAPSLGAGLISSERENGTWQLLRMTPLSPAKILTGKLLSVVWPLLLVLCATLPGYIVLMTLKPELAYQMERVVICLALAALFAVLVSATASALFRSTAAASTASYFALLSVWVMPLLVWLGRAAPFGHETVQTVLSVSPLAAALQAAAMPGFTHYDLLPMNWWIMIGACLGLVLLLCARTWQLCRPD